MISLIKIDRTFTRPLEVLPEALRRSYSQLIKNGELSLRGNEITKAILFRLKTYYDCQNNIKEFLGKKYICSAADFFVESVLFYLKAYVEKNRLRLEISSELQLKRQHNSPRPDISIWKGSKLLAVIECKTQLGRSRLSWKDDLSKCRDKINAIYPRAKFFYVVMTKENWPGFGKDRQVGKKLFVLSDIWPTDLDSDNIEANIINPIEDLFRQIKDFR